MILQTVRYLTVGNIEGHSDCVILCIPSHPARPVRWPPVLWRPWSGSLQRTPRPGWAKLWSWKILRWPWSSSSMPTSKRSDGQQRRLEFCLKRWVKATLADLILQVLEKEKKRSRKEKESDSEEEEEVEVTQRSQRAGRKRWVFLMKICAK